MMSAPNIGSPGVRIEADTRRPSPVEKPALEVGLLTGGDDRSYAWGLTEALAAQGVQVDFIGSDKLDGPELRRLPQVRFLNLRGDQREDVGAFRKVRRLLLYYCRLLKYALVAQPRVFHILWNNKFEWFDRTLLLGYYRFLGRRIVFTAHNVNAGKRDGCDSAWNRFTLGIQYRLVSHLFVHTERMKRELLEDFGVPESKVSVIPFGINNTTPITDLTSSEARRRLGLRDGQKVALFFGQIAPYKGLEYLVAALPDIIRETPDFRLIIAGKVKKGNEAYWSEVERKLADPSIRPHIVCRIEHIPDGDVELYFKAADVLVIPYVHIFQSGVPFLAYSYGLPVVATDVGALKDDIVEGKTGFICKPCAPEDLSQTLSRYFMSAIWGQLPTYRAEIQAFANARYSWNRVADITTSVYQRLSARPG